MKKDKNSKDLLFERMEYLNPDFKYKEKLNENINVKQITNIVKDKLKLDNWNDPQNIEKRKKYANETLRIYNEIMKTLESTVTNEKKAKLINSLLKVSWVGSIIKTIWEVLHPETTKFWIFTTSVDWSDAKFWGSVAILLFILQFLHKFLYKAYAIKSDLSSVWSGVKNFIGRLMNKNKSTEEISENMEQPVFDDNTINSFINSFN